MKKQWMLILLLTAALALCCVSGIAEEEGGGQVSPMDLIQGLVQSGESPLYSLPDDYDPASEEDNAVAVVPAVSAGSGKVYAGATPIPIDPIDLPTPTPRPELTFTYGDYVASKLGLTFKSAVGYEVNDNISGKYILTEPAAAVKDNYPCTITLEISGITKNYAVSDVKTSLARYLSAEGAQYETWETMQAASKTLMNGKGYYNNYRGVLSDGTIVRGRVHMAIINDSQLLTLHISCPGWFNSSYMKIYDQIHSSIKPIQ
ncbi:MAG: hypothetical protein IJ214_12690 [Clostridia bacterium]|nr:hypothetical protein [Clostridia bacterium]